MKKILVHFGALLLATVGLSARGDNITNYPAEPAILPGQTVLVIDAAHHQLYQVAQSNLNAATAGALAGNQTFTNQFIVFTNTLSPQFVNLGAMIQALPQAANMATFGGGKIQLNPGVYYTGTNGNIFNKPFMFELAGSAYGQTAIVFTNWDGETPAWWLASGTGNVLSDYIHDLYICTTTDCTNAILSITNTARDYLARLVICNWQYATNAQGQAGGFTAYAAYNTLGLNISSQNGQETILNDVDVPGNWVGAAIGVDHLRVLGHLGIEIDGLNIPHSSHLSPNPNWGTNIYSLGAGLILNAGENEDTLAEVHEFGTFYGLIKNFNDTSSHAQVFVLAGDTAESSAGYRSLSVYTNDVPIVFLFKHQFSGGQGIDGILSFAGTNWNVIAQSPPNIVDIYQNGIGTNVSLNFAVGGQTSLTLTAGGAIINGTGSGLAYTNSAGATFHLKVNSTTNGFVFTAP